MASPAQTKDVDLTVIIPVYDNAATIGELLDRLGAVLDELPLESEVVLVDDGSRDDSLALLRERAARDRRLRVFALTRNFGGQAAACAAIERARGRWVLSIDADLENCPEDIPAFVAELERGYDLVCGFRDVRTAPWLTRRLPSLLMNAWVRRRTGTAIRDLGCGMKGCQAWLLHDLEAEGDARRLLPPLLLQRARTVAEVPIRRGVAHAPGGHSFTSLLGMTADYYLATAARPFLVTAADRRRHRRPRAGARAGTPDGGRRHRPRHRLDRPSAVADRRILPAHLPARAGNPVLRAAQSRCRGPPARGPATG